MTEGYGMRLTTGRKLMWQHNVEEASKDINWAMSGSI